MILCIQAAFQIDNQLIDLAVATSIIMSDNTLDSSAKEVQLGNKCILALYVIIMYIFSFLQLPLEILPL